MKIYACIRPGANYARLIKVGETNGCIEKRIREQESTGLDEFTVIWEDTVWTQRYGIDKRIHQVLREHGFRNPPLPTGEPSEYFECSVEEVKKAFEFVKAALDAEERQREEVGNQFYLELRNWFYWASPSAPSPDYTLRIIVRLLLCFFLKDKELVPKELLDENWLKENLKESEHRFYNGILRNLFFHCLNTPMKGRTDFEHTKIFRNVSSVKEQLQKIPFLNGGLFNEHEGDDVPLHNKYFFQETETIYLDALGGKYKVAGLVRTLSNYHYKLTLDDLTDKAEYLKTIDPEFIGKVFESLLDCIIVETKESRRKVTGSYYTPREVVEYMINESFNEYLKTGSGLLQCRILDPACGSGAFPCAVMNILMQRIDPDKQLSQTERYRKKLEILQKVIYGVDIQPTAVQITVLRLFLSLIQDITQDKRNDNYGIEPLPNLEMKFVCADTLIPLQKQEKQQRIEMPGIRETVKQLQLTRAQYIVANNHAEKQRLQEYDADLRHTLSVYLEQSGALSHDAGEKLAAWNPYEQTKPACFFDSYYMFGVEKFDIIIGNPPYGAKYPKHQEKYFKEHYVSAQTIAGKQKGSLDTFSLFIEYGFNSVKINGVVNLIVPLAVVSSDSMAALHHLLFQNCGTVKVSSYAKRPMKMFPNAEIRTTIIEFIRTDTKCRRLLTTKLNRLVSETGRTLVLRNLKFADGLRFCLKGRIPKISQPIESRILRKLFAKKHSRIKALFQEGGKPVYYRTSGGLYYNVITNYPTGSTKEKPLFFDKKYADVIGAVLSGNLFWWYQQVYSNNLDLKLYEMESFPIPTEHLTPAIIKKIEKVYGEYLRDIEKHAVAHETTAYENVTKFKEYKLVYSKPLIDKMDDLICPLYGLTEEETAFIKNYELEFRLRGEQADFAKKTGE